MGLCRKIAAIWLRNSASLSSKTFNAITIEAGPSRSHSMSDEITSIQKDLTEVSVSKESYPDTLYQRQLFEQYRMCVEMADRISHRRNLANTLFLTLNTAVLAALATMVEKADSTDVNVAIQIIALTGLILSCFAWIVLIRSYRQLNTAKFKVIGAYERMLPTSPWFNAEWKALGEGKDKTTYTPLTVVETYVPILLMVVCVAMAGVLLLVAR